MDDSAQIFMHPLCLDIRPLFASEHTNTVCCYAGPESMLMCVINHPKTHEFGSIWSGVQLRDETATSHRE